MKKGLKILLIVFGSVLLLGLLIFIYFWFFLDLAISTLCASNTLNVETNITCTSKQDCILALENETNLQLVQDFPREMDDPSLSKILKKMASKTTTAIAFCEGICKYAQTRELNPGENCLSDETTITIYLKGSEFVNLGVNSE